MSMQGKLGIERMCQLAGVSRASFYRWLQAELPVEEDLEVRSNIQKIFLENKRRYGYRRVSKELRERGMQVNRKRVARLMRQDNLLAVQPAAFVTTTDSDHELEVHLNLASRMNLTGIQQLWVADITYIRLQGEFVYLAVILDAFSRKVVGWELGRELTARLALAALQKALAERKPPAGLVHHSDRGVQYASSEYVGLLRQHGLLPSMSRPANPYDNACCESFMRTLKREEIHANKYRDLEDLRRNIAAFIEHYYNQVRLHSALDYQSPAGFERSLATQPAWPGASMSFFRHGEIFQSDVGLKTKGKPAETGSPDHRLDESPAGYSLAGCSPAEPTYASPTEDHCEGTDTFCVGKIIER
jgi:putative transposase